jgi:hypothetical protein
MMAVFGYKNQAEPELAEKIIQEKRPGTLWNKYIKLLLLICMTRLIEGRENTGKVEMRQIFDKKRHIYPKLGLILEPTDKILFLAKHRIKHNFKLTLPKVHYFENSYKMEEDLCDLPLKIIYLNNQALLYFESGGHFEVYKKYIQTLEQNFNNKSQLELIRRQSKIFFDTGKEEILEATKSSNTSQIRLNMDVINKYINITGFEGIEHYFKIPFHKKHFKTWKNELGKGKNLGVAQIINGLCLQTKQIHDKMTELANRVSESYEKLLEKLRLTLEVYDLEK